MTDSDKKPDKEWAIKHTIDVRFSTSVERTERVLDVSQAFGLELADKEFVIYDNLQFETYKGMRIYVTGESGSGKSIILRKLQENYEAEGLNVSNINDVEFEDKPIIEQVGKNTEEATKLLQFAGIGDAYLLIRKPSELSDGQKYRLRVAKLLEKESDVWICDEFGAVLDRITAKFLANALWKMSAKKKVTVVVATTHKDLMYDFGANLIINKKYAHGIDITKFDKSWVEEY